MKSAKLLLHYIDTFNPIRHLFIVLNAPVENVEKKAQVVSFKNTRALKFQFT